MATYEQLCETLTDNGYIFETHELDWYFKVTTGNVSANLSVNPDDSISFFLYNRDDNVNDEGTAFSADVISIFESIGFKNAGASADGSDCFFEKITNDVIDAEKISSLLNEHGFGVKCFELKGGHYLSIVKKDGADIKNGKSNVSLNADGTASFFSDELDIPFANKLVELIESLGFKNSGKGIDGSMHFFLGN